jgi:hypothetical protein
VQDFQNQVIFLIRPMEKFPQESYHGSLAKAGARADALLVQIGVGVSEVSMWFLMFIFC